MSRASRAAILTAQASIVARYAVFLKLICMSRAKDIFEKLRGQGLAALDDLIVDREPESLFLDFKRSPDDGSSRVLADEDSKNLCKAISGFANSSGGVVIWGVDCRRDAAGNEVASKMPVADAHGFNTKLQGAISRSSIPPHPGVEVIAIPGEDPASSRGYVAVHIPQSTFGPVRSVKSHQYHLRTGSDFAVVPHELLAGMFGRGPQPQVDLNIASYPARLDGRPGHLTISFGLLAVNLGVVLVERPYVSVNIWHTPRNRVHVQVQDTDAFSLRQSPLPVFSVIAEPHLALAPGGVEKLCDMVVDVPVDQPHAIRFECVIGGAGAMPKRFTMEASLEAVIAGIARAGGGSFPSSEVVQLVMEA